MSDVVPPDLLGDNATGDAPVADSLNAVSTAADVTISAVNNSATVAAAASEEVTATETSQRAQDKKSSKDWTSMMVGGMAGSFSGFRGRTTERGTASQTSSNHATTPTSNDVNKDKNNPKTNSSKSSETSNSSFFSSFSSNVNNLTNSLTTNLNNAAASATSTSISLNATSSLNSFSSSLTSFSSTLGLKNTLPDKTTASQVLMFRQLLHTSCRPGLRLSRAYQGTPAQKAVMHMPWWERGIESTGKMVISYDNLITRLWISGAILPFARGGYAELFEGDDAEESLEVTLGEGIGDDGASTANATAKSKESKPIDTFVNEKGLPPIPHQYWVDRLGFQQDDPVTDFRSGGVLSLAMLVHIVESCPSVHARFVPKPGTTATNGGADGNKNNDIPTELEEIIRADASVLPFGICSINVTDMLAKFLMFSKSVDKMDALLSSKPFWKMFMDSPNAMLVLQEVSLDLLCDVVVEIGRERRLAYLMERNNNSKDVNNIDEKDGNNGNGKGKKKVGMHDNKRSKVTVFDFTEIMERTEKRVENEILGAGPQNVDELRAVARRVKSKYLMRIQSKEKYIMKSEKANAIPSISAIGTALPSKESMKNVTSSMIGGMGGFVNMWKHRGDGAATTAEGTPTSSTSGAATEAAVITAAVSTTSDGGKQGNHQQKQLSVNTSIAPISSKSEVASQCLPTTPENPFKAGSLDGTNSVTESHMSAVAEAFDLLGADLSPTIGMEDADVDLLDALDQKLDPSAAFTIDDDDF